MPDRIVAILGGLRRRLLAARSAEAGAVGGAVGGLTAAALMAAWILAGEFPAAAATAAALPLAAGLTLALSRAARAKLHPAGFMRVYLTVVLLACGAVGLAAILTGTFIAVGKNLLILLAPAASVGAAGLCLLRGAPIAGVARWADRQADLRDRLATAWELAVRQEASPFAQAVREQALVSARTLQPGRVRFWSRTPATLAALGLALAAAVLMLPWTPLESPQARQERHWRQASRQAGESLQEQLPPVAADLSAASPQLAQQVARLAELAQQLRAAKPGEARQWQGKVVELDRLAESLRRIASAGGLDEQTARRLNQVIRALEQVSAQMAEAMSESPSTALARNERGSAGPPRPIPAASLPVERGWVTVYDPRYAELATRSAEPAGAHNGNEHPPAVAQVPYEQAWQEAKVRAAQFDARKDIPPEYRQLVRDYFSGKP